jgi:hypothetical protein
MSDGPFVIRSSYLLHCPRITINLNYFKSKTKSIIKRTEKDSRFWIAPAAIKVRWNFAHEVSYDDLHAYFSEHVPYAVSGRSWMQYGQFIT